jgi:hypothetical protein
MSMNTHIVGIKAADETWKKMKAVYDACIAADAPVPDKVDDYFGGASPDPHGVIVDLENCGKKRNGLHPAVKEYNDSENESSGYEIEIAKLPKDLTHIRVYNSW